MADLTDISSRFPGLADGSARFDGPAGTQVVDSAIDAAAEWQRSGRNANSHGAFPAARACDALVERVDDVMGELLGANPAGMVYGPSTTANMMSLTRAVAHASGARVAVDGVHLTPHRAGNLSEIGCDVYATSSYKWYGPHAGIMWVEPTLLDELAVYKVRPAPERGPGRLQYGTPSWEALAGVEAAARFLLDTGFEAIEAHEATRFSRLLTGLGDLPGVRVVGPPDTADRAPTLLFLVDGHSPEAVAARLAESRVAVWHGHNYAVEAMGPLGLDEAGGVRAGVCVYIGDDDVDRLLAAVAAL